MMFAKLNTIRPLLEQLIHWNKGFNLTIIQLLINAMNRIIFWAR